MLTLAAVLSVMAPAAGALVLDDFEGPLRWQAIPSDGVQVRLSLEEGRVGKALRIDYDFRGRGGFALAQLDLDLELPANYAFDFYLRADSPSNNFEFKLMDATGENVWWRNLIDFTFPREWTRQTIRKRHIGFAWGPLGGGELRRVASLQFGIAAFTGGKGTVWIDSLRFRALDPPLEDPPAPLASASASLPGKGPEGPVTEGGGEWRAPAGAGATYTLDFRAMREFGGLTLVWSPGAHPPRWQVQLTTDGATWETVAGVPSNGGRDDLRLADAEARGLRLVIPGGGPAEVGLASIQVRPVEFGASPNDFWSAIAREAPRGQYPRAFLGEQTYFTAIGSNGGASEALLSEDGQLEVEKRGPSLEPFLRVNGKTLTWADAPSHHALRHGWMPIPSVTRRHGGLTLRVEAVPCEVDETVFVTYRVGNDSAGPAESELAVALRPFQVNPPWQSLNMVGGVAPTPSIEWREGVAWLADGTAIVPPREAGPFLGTGFFSDEIGARLFANDFPSEGSVEDPQGFASGAWRIPVSLGPGETKTFTFAVNRPHGGASLDRVRLRVERGLPETYGEAPWAAMLGDLRVEMPRIAARHLDVWRSNVAYILVNRDRAGIQPGSRNYERSWIRDGSLTGAALLRAGRVREVREFIEWYAGYLPETGYIPCIVDWRGPEPTPQHDAHGQWIFAIAEYFRFTGDLEFVRELYPTVRRTVAFLDRLRNERRTPEFQTPEKRMFYGIVPESMSHEGYAAKPMHSYWDNFFVVKGLKDAAFLARALGETADAQAWEAFRKEFQRDFYNSVMLSMERHGIDFFPGCAELGDFDATSTSIGLYPCGEYDAMPQEARDATFDRYWRFFAARRDGAEPWTAYTPYELRVINTFLILGRPEEAHALIDYFMGHLRPQGWNHWAEVVWEDPRIPRFIGDMPHTWVGSEWVKALRNLFVMEREDGSLMVGKGVPAAWCVEGEPVVWSGLPTYGGRLGLRWETRGGKVEVSATGPEALRGVIHPPMGATGDPVRFERLPARAAFHLAAP
jgi:hypothetical protein